MTLEIHLCSWTQGLYRVHHDTGKQVVFFEDSEQFGPSKWNPRTGDLDMIPEKHWFWRLYGPWRKAGRPTEGLARSAPDGEYRHAVRASE